MSADARIRRVVGRAVAVRGNNIDTDRIIPARYMKEITFSRMGEFPFYDERFDSEGKPKPHPFNDPRFQGASILLVNQNFGCGSSREHAPQALYRFGIQAIIGESFAAIFTGNCVMMGIPPVTVSSSLIEKLMREVEAHPETSLTIDLASKTLSSSIGQIGSFEIPETARKALLEGFWDSTSLLLSNTGKVGTVVSRLPYLSGFGN